MKTDRGKVDGVKLPALPVVFYLPVSHLPLSAYARLTGQTLRAVSQQADSGKLLLVDSPGKERQVNIVYEFLRDFNDAQTKMNLNVE